MYSKSENVTNIQQVLAEEIKALELLKANLSEMPLDKVVASLMHLKGKVIATGMGKSGFAARIFASTMSSMGTPAIYLHPAEASHGDLGIITKDDVVVLYSASGKTAELAPIVEYCKRNEIYMLAITNNSESALAKAANQAIIMPFIGEVLHKMPSTSLMQAIAISHALIVAVAKAKNFELHDYNKLHPGGAIGLITSPVSNIMHLGKELPLVTVNCRMHEAVIEMTTKRLGCVGIVDEKNKLVGVISDGDLRRHLSPELLSQSVTSVMNKHPITIPPILTVEEALQFMNHKKITNLFVEENEQLLGIVHVHDCLKLIR